MVDFLEEGHMVLGVMEVVEMIEYLRLQAHVPVLHPVYLHRIKSRHHAGLGSFVSLLHNEQSEKEVWDIISL